MRISQVLVAGALFFAGGALAAPPVFPEVIPLPTGFAPEGIVRGYGAEFFTGSLVDGSIYKGDLRTGDGAILVQGGGGEASVGLSFDERTGYLFVAGGGPILGLATSVARVYDTDDGSLVGFYELSNQFSFVNDVVVTRSAAYFTDSLLGVLYRLPLSANGDLPDPSAVEVVPLGGDFVITGGIDANGIDATADGKALLISHSSLGYIYRVDPLSGDAVRIDLGGILVDSADGIQLSGRTLYVAQALLNQIAVVELAPDLSSGALTGTITDSAFDIPSALDVFGNNLYAVNSRLSVPPDPSTEYSIVKVPKR